MWRMGMVSIALHGIILIIWGWRFSLSNPPQPTPLIIEFKNIQDVTRAPKIGQVIDDKVNQEVTPKPTDEPAALVDVEKSTPPEESADDKKNQAAPKEEKQEQAQKDNAKEPKPEPLKEPAKEKPKVEKKEEQKKDNNKNTKKSPKDEKNKKDPKKKKEEKKPEKAYKQLRKGSKQGDKKAPRNKEGNPQKAKDALDKLLGDASDSGASELGELSASHIDAMRSALKPCWAVPAGLLDVRNQSVDIKLDMNPDGSVKKATILDQVRLKTDSNFRIAAEAAQRAVLDPACQPLPLPKDKYEVWKEMEITFNAESMFG